MGLIIILFSILLAISGAVFIIQGRLHRPEKDDKKFRRFMKRQEKLLRRIEEKYNL